MGREINVEAGNRLNLQDAAALGHADYRIPAAAFERCERLAQVGGSAILLDAVAEIAAEAGYRGTVDQAGGILRREGRFIVEPGPSGRLDVRRGILRHRRLKSIFPAFKSQGFRPTVRASGLSDPAILAATTLAPLEGPPPARSVPSAHPWRSLSSGRPMRAVSLVNLAVMAQRAQTGAKGQGAAIAAAPAVTGNVKRLDGQAAKASRRKAISQMSMIRPPRRAGAIGRLQVCRESAERARVRKWRPGSRP